jgi:hypothetical protein
MSEQSTDQQTKHIHETQSLQSHELNGTAGKDRQNDLKRSIGLAGFVGVIIFILAVLALLNAYLPNFDPAKSWFLTREFAGSPIQKRLNNLSVREFRLICDPKIKKVIGELTFSEMDGRPVTQVTSQTPCGSNGILIRWDGESMFGSNFDPDLVKSTVEQILVLGKISENLDVHDDQRLAALLNDKYAKLALKAHQGSFRVSFTCNEPDRHYRFTYPSGYRSSEKLDAMCSTRAQNFSIIVKEENEDRAAKTMFRSHHPVPDEVVMQAYGEYLTKLGLRQTF